jgi:hypothetical protein
VQTRTRNAVALAIVLAAGGAGLVLAGRKPAPALNEATALDAIPSGAMLVATVDLTAVRSSSALGPLLRGDREIPGLGKVRDACGFDPLDGLRELVIAIPTPGSADEATGPTGDLAETTSDLGLAASGAVDAEALIACASKVITSRGGQPKVTSIGSFRAVRDASAGASSGEIAARPGGLLLLGGGPYLRAMIDAADNRVPRVRASPAHADLAAALGEGAARVTMVLTPGQRRDLAEELAESGAAGAPSGAITALGLSARLGPEIALHGVLTCNGEAPCRSLADRLAQARAARAGDVTVRLSELGAILDAAQIEPSGAAVHVYLAVPEAQAASLIERLLLRGGGNRASRLLPSPEGPRADPRHDPAPSGSAQRAPAPDEALTPRPEKPR